MKHLLIAALCLLSTSLIGGNLEKGFESLGIKDYFKAFKQFEKAIFRNPTGGAYGFSLIYAEPKNHYFDLDSAMKYILYADSSLLSADERERSLLNELSINRNILNEHKQHIADVAYGILQNEISKESMEIYLRKYSYSQKHGLIMTMRDSLAFVETEKEGSYKAYRQFIIDYPGSRQRRKADSLYALKFYEEKTKEGDVESFKNFAREFSANPHATEAYDQIYSKVRASDTVKEYYDHIRSFPNTPYANDAWQRLTDLYLLTYTQDSFGDLLWDYPDNPYSEEIEKEMKHLFAPRFLMKSGEKWSLIDANGQSVTKKSYDSIQEFSEGLAVVTLNGLSGYIDREGNERTALEFEDALPFSGGFAVVEKGELYGTINRHGETIIPFEYVELGQYQDFLIPASKGNGFVYLDRRGQLSIPDIYEEASDFEDGYGVVKVDGKFGLIDVEGEFKIPALYDWVESFDAGYARLKNEGLFGLYKYQQGLIIEPEYDMISTASDGYRIIVKEGKFGYTNQEGEIVIPIQFDFSDQVLKESMFNLDHAKIKEKGLYGVIDSQGEFVIKPTHSQLGEIKSSILWYQELNRFGYVDFSGTVQKATYDFASDFAQGVAIVGENGLRGLINYRGDYLLEPVYSKLNVVSDTEFCIFTQNGEQGIVHRDGKELLRGEFDSIEVIKLRYAKTSLNGTFKYFDLDEHREITLAK